jgi:hypothetical protein
MNRVTKALAALAVAGASILSVTSQASADPNPNNHGSNPLWIELSTTNHVGVYTSPNAGSSKFDNLTLAPWADEVLADCWVVGANVGNAGDVWYRTEAVYHNNQQISVGTSWTFGPYVDGAAVFHTVPDLPAC